MNREVMKQALEALQEAVYKAGWIGMSPEGADEIQREVDEYVTHRLEPAITALRTAIEAAEKQEPSYYGLTNDHLWMSVSKEQYGKLKPAFRMACYTTPPAAQPAPEDYTALEQALSRLQKRYGELEAKVAAQREWVGLTDEDCKGMNVGDMVVAMWADRILKEKNK
jgi:hypothetical protein